MKGVKNYLLKTFGVGFVILVPIAVTFLVGKLIFQFLDGLLHGVLQYLPHIPDAPGVGMGFAVAIILLAGIIGRNVIGKKLVHIGQQAILRIPIVKAIYSPVKQGVESLASIQGNQQSNKVVRIEYPRLGTWSYGLLVDIREVNGTPQAVVYIPTSPTPQTGFLVELLPKDVHETDWPINSFMPWIVTLGLVGPKAIKTISKTSQD